MNQELRTLSEMIDKNETLTCLQKLQIFKNLCCEVEKLHTQNISHNFLCPQNIYIDGLFNVILKQSEDNLSVQKFNWEYGSPEILMSYRDPQNSFVTPQSDIWSLGLLLNVIFTMKHIRYVRGCVGFIEQSNYFFDIIPMCMKQQPLNRPTISHLYNFLIDFENRFFSQENYNMKEAYKLFEQQRYISSLIKLQRLSSNDFLEQSDDIEIRGNNDELEDIKFEYKNFLFHASSKNEKDNLYLLVQDKQKLTQNQMIKADKYEILINELNNQDGKIGIQIKDSLNQQCQYFNYQLNEEDYILIGQKEGNTIKLNDLNNEELQLEIFRQSDGIYVKQISNNRQSLDCNSSMSSIDSGNVYIKLERDTPIFHQSVLCTENQRYYVKAIC